MVAPTGIKVKHFRPLKRHYVSRLERFRHAKFAREADFSMSSASLDRGRIHKRH